MAACVVGVANPQFTTPIAFDAECCSSPVCEEPVLVSQDYYPAPLPVGTTSTGSTTGSL